jgi:hypothetical protein
MDDRYSELNNEERAYVGLHDAMMKLYNKKDMECFKLLRFSLIVA